MADKDPRLERLKELSKNKFKTVEERTEQEALAAEYPQFNVEQDEKEDVPQTSPSPSSATTNTGATKSKK
jgi:hypothetical protein